MSWPTWLKYGNWTGPGWSGGQWVSDPALVNWDAPAKNKLDQLGKVHDWDTQHGDMPQWQTDAKYIRGACALNPQGFEENAVRVGVLIIMTPACIVRRVMGV